MRVLVITGAGVSVESGIPTFRGKDGYWRNLDPAKLATPEAFAKNPNLVWEWYRERRQRIRNAQPNTAHQAIAKLAQHAREFLLVTQNVDDLHVRAEWEGNTLVRRNIVQIHGDIFITRCSHCDFSRNERDRDVGGLPKCPQCGALVRPGAVWFGEPLDLGEVHRVENFLDEGACDFALVIGTTVTFGYIVAWALRAISSNGELVEVNPEETSLSRFATHLIREPAAVALPRLVDELLIKHVG